MLYPQFFSDLSGLSMCCISKQINWIISKVQRQINILVALSREIGDGSCFCIENKVLAPVYFDNPVKTSFWSDWEGNMHTSLDLCPRPARKKTNVPLHKIS